MDVEICINSDDGENLRRDVSSAWSGGAARIELCSAMHLDGLTPSPDSIASARDAFRDRPGLMVMIRPRGGDFYYSAQEIATMLRQIEIAARQGADGVVIGVLRKKDDCVDVRAMRLLLGAARNEGLAVTFHRAVDATPDPLATLEKLSELGVDRILSSGVRWGAAGGAVQGMETLSNMTARSRQVEIIIGGGVGPANARRIVDGITLSRKRVSLHAYSSVLVNGVVNKDNVRALVAAAESSGF